ncbi:hypothetical protein GWI76_16035 [Proteus sp. G2659]|uniref:hypothetical protein n=1 Tax=Proteus TaxID=583 RepID=UPI00137879C6|nr:MULTISPECIES: hypothetical protein [Proteus]NBM80739.1 hypothetical protein [Proteus sp. G2659]
MKSIEINGTFINRSKIDLLSNHRTPDDIISLKGKIKDFFSKNKEKEALTLIHNIYYNNSISITEKIAYFEKLDSIIGDNYKGFFSLKYKDNKIIFEIDNEPKTTFSSKEFVHDIIINGKSNTKENINFNTNTNINLLSDNTFIDEEVNSIVQKMIFIPDDDSILSIVEKIKTEFLLSLTEKLNKQGNIEIIKPEYFKFVFNENSNIDILKAIKNILSPDNSIKEKIKAFKLLNTMIKRNYEIYLSLKIENDKIKIRFANFNQQFDLSDLIKEMLPTLKEKHTEFDNKEKSIEDIKKSIINYFNENKNNEPTIFKLSILELTKNKIKEASFIDKIKKNSEVFNPDKAKEYIKNYKIEDKISQLYISDKITDFEKIKIINELYNYLTEKIEKKTFIEINNSSITLSVMEKNNEHIKLEIIKTNKDYSFLNDIHPEVNNGKKLPIILELEKDTGFTTELPLDDKLINTYLSKAYNNKTIYYFYYDLLMNNIKYIFNNDYSNFIRNQNEFGISINQANYNFIAKEIDEINKKHQVESENKKILRYFYSIINNKEHPYHTKLTEIGSVYFEYIKNSQLLDNDMRANKYMTLFFNKKEASLKDKFNSFFYLKSYLNRKSILDFNLTQDSIELFQRSENGEIKQSTSNPLDKNIINQILPFDKKAQLYILYYHLVEEMPLNESINEARNKS